MQFRVPKSMSLELILNYTHRFYNLKCKKDILYPVQREWTQTGERYQCGVE
jgi:hypothetical protein